MGVGGLGGSVAAGVGSLGGAAPPAALLACGIPPSDLVREAFSYAVNICQVCVYTPVARG